MKQDQRFPYTYAADYIRFLAGYGEKGTKLSRSDASRVQRGIADAIGMEHAELAEMLAKHLGNILDSWWEREEQQVLKDLQSQPPTTKPDGSGGGL